MSETEDAATTLARLLRTKMRVVKDDEALANVSVTSEWQTSEALKNLDGQVTVGLAESSDQKIDLSGKKRRRTHSLRVSVWSTDAPGTSEPARVMRRKIVDEVIRVIRQNRAKPNLTVYDFVSIGAASENHKAYRGNDETSPYAQSRTELSSDDYSKLWFSDDQRCTISYSQNGEKAVMLVRFKIESREKAVKKIVLTFEGYGTAPGGDGVQIKVWNHESGVWENTKSGGASGIDETLTIDVESDLSDYVDDSGYIWFLAQTSNASDGETPATLLCDYVSCTVTVNGITYCDVLSYRNVDRVDLKPFVFSTEINVKSWFFENIGE
jgi:hypothetical protein